MSAQDTSFGKPVPPAWLARVSSGLSQVVSSPWTPSAISVGACLSILLSAGGALLHTRLGELAVTAIAPAEEPSVQTAILTPDPDFTLDPDALREISMDEARMFNASLPFSTLPILSARPFIMPPQQIADYARALDCLTAAVYYEAASETAAGQAAVAQVVINRMRHPAFPKTICGVVFQGQERATDCQFSFTCDGAMARVPSPAAWARARAVAAAALNGVVAPQVGMATHYHTDWVAPYWAERLVKIAQIDTHIFYRWTGAWGLPGAFTGRHAGPEPLIENLSRIAGYSEDLEEPSPETLTVPVHDALGYNSLPDLDNMSTTNAELFVDSTPLPAADLTQQPEIPTPAHSPILQNPLVETQVETRSRRTRIAVPR